MKFLKKNTHTHVKQTYIMPTYHVIYVDKLQENCTNAQLYNIYQSQDEEAHFITDPVNTQHQNSRNPQFKELPPALERLPAPP